MSSTTTTTPSKEIRLKRFLYTSKEEPIFITGDAYYHNAYQLEKVKVVEEIIQSGNLKLLLNIVEIINSENLLPRRDTIFFVLACAAIGTTDNDFKRDIYTTLLNIAKSSNDIFTFLKFYTLQHKTFNSSLNKMISAYYYKKDPMELAEEVTKSNGCHGWTHKDMLKLCHGKSSCIRTQTVVTYVLHGLTKAKLTADENEAAKPIIKLLSNAVELKRCENEKRIVELIKKLRCNNINQIPSFFHKSQTVWETLIPQLPLSELITLLPRLYKYGFLKANSSVQTKFIEAVNHNAVKASKIHPLEIFITLKNFEKGGKPMDPRHKVYLEEKLKDEESKENVVIKVEPVTHEPIKCPPIVTALNKAMQTSFQNISSTGRRIFICVEVSKEMDSPCLTSKNVSCFEAATILILCFLKSERDVTVAVFNSVNFTVVNLTKNSTIHEVQSTLRKASSGLAMLSPVFEWAIKKKKQVDVFINFLQSKSFTVLPREHREKNRSLQLLEVYRKSMALPHTKIISFFLNSPHTTLSNGSPNVLDVCGIDKNVTKVIEAFSKGLFC